MGMPVKMTTRSGAPMGQRKRRYYARLLKERLYGKLQPTRTLPAAVKLCGPPRPFRSARPGRGILNLKGAVGRMRKT